MELFAAFQSFTEIGTAAGASFVFGLVGIVLLILGFKAFDFVTPKLDLEVELSKGNISVGIVVGSLLLAIGYIVSHVVG
ncbi:MAG: DUF350 domain-containing protein [Gemmataceae bacterium]